MFRRGLALCAVLGFASVAVADIEIQLRPDAPGPYALGQVVNVEAFFVDDGSGHPVTGADIALRGYQVDFADTDAALGLPAAMTLPLDDTGGFLHAMFPDLPRPSQVYSGSTPSPFQFTIPAAGEFMFGDVDVTVNNSGWLDVMNADDPGDNAGAWINFGFGLEPDGSDPVTTWRARTEELTGGRLFMEVPEPASLALLALGGLAALRRRRTA